MENGQTQVFAVVGHVNPQIKRFSIPLSQAPLRLSEIRTEKSAMLVSLARTVTIAVAAAALCVTISQRAEAITFKVTGALTSASFANFSPSILSDVSFVFEIDVPDPEMSFTQDPVQLKSFSGVNINGTVFDLSLTDAFIESNITVPSLVIVVGGSPAGILSRGENDFRIEFAILGATLADAVKNDVIVPIFGAAITNANEDGIDQGSGLAGSARVSAVAPIPLPATAPVLLVALGGLSLIRHRQRDRLCQSCLLVKKQP